MKISKWTVALTGASGMPYALRLLRYMAETGQGAHIVISEAACRVLKEEHGVQISLRRPSIESLLGESYPNFEFSDPRDIGAAAASGVALADGMVVVPCSMASLAAIAHGYAGTLIHRAADVTIKEGRRLILVPRETPLSQIHLANMQRLAEVGATILPAMPGFYHNPSSIDELVDLLVMKILDAMGIENQLVPRWPEQLGAQHLRSEHSLELTEGESTEGKMEGKVVEFAKNVTR